MAHKFTMVNGMFDSGDHAIASDRMQNAMEELKMKQEREEHEKQVEKVNQQKQVQENTYRNKVQDVMGKRNYVQPENDTTNENEDEEDDPELELLRSKRLEKLKKEHKERLENLAKGHGSYREIVQDEFLKQVTTSEHVIVHFYHNDFEKCKVIDMHLERIAKQHIECKVLKLNAEKAPFFVEKLSIRVLPTIMIFKNGVASLDRIVGFEGLFEDQIDGKQENFSTNTLATRLAYFGALAHNEIQNEEK